MLDFLSTRPSTARVDTSSRIFRLTVPARLGKPHPAPYLNTDPVSEDELDGHRIFRPAGHRRTIGHLLHYHGLGAFSKEEIDFLHRLAAGKFQGEPVTVVAPVAQSLAPRDVSFNTLRSFYSFIFFFSKPLDNLQSFYSLACFIRQQPREVQKLLLKSISGDEGFFTQMRKMVRALGNPPWWYPFVFEPTPDQSDSTAKIRLSETASAAFRRSHGRTRHPTLQPDFDATIRLMFKTAREIAPRTDAVLDRTGASRGHICASGFSQGVGPAIVFSAILRPGTFCRLVLICASHIKTPNTPAIRDTELKIDVILPRGDPVLKASGFREPKTRRDLEADFHGRSRIWEPPGGHAVAGHVAHIAGMQIVSALRHSHRTSPANALLEG